MKMEWLKNKTTFVDCERDWNYSREPVRHACDSDEAWEQHLERRKIWIQSWEKFKNKYREGDELWTFSGSLMPGAKIDLAYRAGVCIVRNGKIMDGWVHILS